jgi:5-methylcytosine-specific restriction endonuclease McrA
MPTNEYMAAYMAKRYEQRRIHYIDKMGGKCVTCGSTHSLEFDHIDPNQKSFDVSKRMAGMSIPRLEAELAKCQLLCAKCHSDKSILDLGHQPWKHGTLSGYRYCRCNLCKAAKSDHSKQARINRLAKAAAMSV